MLDIQFIRHNADQVRAAITNKRLDLDLDALLAADKDRREKTTTLEQKRARKNELSAQIPKASKDDRPKLVEVAKQVRADIDAL
ncbi:MAG: serine--tRNA ligase, partial [Polyangiaceae bacterium]